MGLNPVGVSISASYCVSGIKYDACSTSMFTTRKLSRMKPIYSFEGLNKASELFSLRNDADEYSL